MNAYPQPQIKQGIDGLALAAFLLIGFGALIIYREISSNHEYSKPSAFGVENQTVTENQEAQPAEGELSKDQGVHTIQNVAKMVSAPYDDYTLTQGPHGFSYGHMAIDLSAGKGAIIKSPIQGIVADLYTDRYGNPTLVLENEYYLVTMLHGKFKVAIGDQIAWGQMIGRESNLGLTTDMQGRSCNNRACGYHTHINIYDKQLGQNVNPLEIFK